MEHMEWQGLLARSRHGEPQIVDAPERPAFLVDLDRVIFSQPFRRLANKTQVHPLYENDHLHHRMIHSLETSSVGRSLGVNVGQALAARGILPDGAGHDLSYILQAACAAHDIGNPPFGHAGEDAISEWFATRRPFGEDLSDGQRREFEHFEGNAQGFRILTRMEMYRLEGGMRLTHAVLGAFTKYPCLAKDGALGRDAPTIGLKKYGAFEAEAAHLAEMAESTGLIPQEAGWRRHPLAFLVEAADNICYNILDLEDAYTTGVLSHGEVRPLLEALIGKEVAPVPGGTPAEHVGHLRARAVHGAIRASVAAFLDHHDEILSGRFSTELTDVFALKEAFAAISEVANDRIFPSSRKIELEVAGRDLIFALLDRFHAVIEGLAEHGWDAAAMAEKKPYLRKLVTSAGMDLRDVCDPYSGLHALTDFISGMTDRYAVKMARPLGL
ncbi:dGTP triphosphohydrolase [Rhodovulum sulfidophilum]|uniref:dGTP triphosphohydrolase n=1 Tax=Rhodovulum sulfidophilum TaxID=35806 RepID=UPI001EE470A0|nr:dNTP triphosphohydrolase [Rhodovulum sulfidophilum]